MTYVAHAAQYDINADEATKRADKHGRDKAVAKEFVFKGCEQVHFVQIARKVQTVQAVFGRFERLERLERFEQVFI
jgi:hypothetical protein